MVYAIRSTWIHKSNGTMPTVQFLYKLLSLINNTDAIKMIQRDTDRERKGEREAGRKRNSDTETEREREKKKEIQNDRGLEGK